MKFQHGDYEAVHRDPIWRQRANFVFSAHIRVKEQRNEWEQLWGQELTSNRFVVCCIPFFVYDVALGDEIETDADFVLQRVVSESGQLTFRVWFGGQDSTTRQDLVHEIEAMKMPMEWSSDNLLAISALESEAQQLVDYLQLRENEGRLQFESGRR